jgi:hypothetical protein
MVFLVLHQWNIRGSHFNRGDSKQTLPDGFARDPFPDRSEPEGDGEAPGRDAGFRLMHGNLQQGRDLPVNFPLARYSSLR